MRSAFRGFVAPSVLIWLTAVLPGTAVAHKHDGDRPHHHATAGANESSDGACGSQPDDADQVAAVRAEADQECDCADATNHGKYVKCVAGVADEEVSEGDLRAECRDAVVSCASQSTCGIENAVTCCRTDANGNTTCSIKRSADACKAPRGGSACVGQVPSCCDACGPDGTCPPPGGTTTTTLAPPATTTTVPSATTTTTVPAETTTTTTEAVTTTTAPTPTTTTLPGSPSGAFLDHLEVPR